MARPERLALWLATGSGLGYAPFAPGTVGSLGALPLAVGLSALGGSWAVLAGAALVAGVGVWCGGVAEAHFGRRDPGPVVIDEIAGQLVSLAFLPSSASALVAGFFLFRLFDIWKPYPARRLERLPGGSGIMADDLAAGIYANLVQQLLRWVFPVGW